MTKKPETKFKENRVIPDLEKLSHFYGEKISQRSNRGTPDYLGVIRGRSLVLELKQSKKEVPEPLQRYKLAKWYLAGAITAVVYPENWDAFYRALVAYERVGFEILLEPFYKKIRVYVKEWNL